MTIQTEGERYDAATFAPNAGEVFDGLPSETYHAGPGVSSSRLKLLAQKSPKHFHEAPPLKRTDALLLGDVVHTLVLEPERFDERFALPSSWAGAKKPNGNKKPENYTAEEREFVERMERAEADGLEVLTKDLRAWTSSGSSHAIDVVALCRAVTDAQEWHAVAGDDPVIERSIYWDEEGVLCRCRPDLLNLQWCGGERAAIVD